jgi:hypothetical protein
VAAAQVQLLGDCEHLLDDDMRALFDRARHDWRALPVEQADELASRAQAWDNGRTEGLTERMALVHALEVELRKGRSLDFDVLRHAATAAFGDKPAREYTRLERKAIAAVLARICDGRKARLTRSKDSPLSPTPPSG